MRSLGLLILILDLWRLLEGWLGIHSRSIVVERRLLVERWLCVLWWVLCELILLPHDLHLSLMVLHLWLGLRKLWSHWIHDSLCHLRRLLEDRLLRSR